MDAKIVSSMIRVHVVHMTRTETIVEVDCHDYDEFKSLPAAIEVEGKVLGKTGWSSDRYYACYKTGVMLGRIIDIRG